MGGPLDGPDMDGKQVQMLSDDIIFDLMQQPQKPHTG